MNKGRNESHKEKVVCNNCGNDKFIVRKSELEGFSFGAGLTARDILVILKGFRWKIQKVILKW